MEAYNRSFKSELYNRWIDLKSERQPWFARWQEIARYIRPDTGSFLLSDQNKPKNSNRIVSPMASSCIHTLGSGLLAGASSPSRPWFNFTLEGVNLNTDVEARLWATQVRDLILDDFNKSNTYLALQTLYEEMATYGTGACLVFEDETDGIRLYPLTAGQYAIATDGRGVVNTLYREIRMTVAQVVDQFGIDHVTEGTKYLYNNRKLDEWITVIHAIEPRKNFDSTKKDAKNKPWGSWYFEENADKDQYLLESGFDYFPALCPRWNLNAGDIYGTGVGMDILPSVKQLQVMEKRKLQGIELTMNPPLQGPPTYRSRTINNFAGGYTVVDATGNNPIKPLVNMNIDTNGLLMAIDKVEKQIRSDTYVDLFLMLQNDTERQMTATEVSERREEKLTILGPMLLRMKDEIHEPLIKMDYAILAANGKLPPLPERLQNLPIKMEFVSMMAQAQKSSDITQMDRLLSVIQPMAQIDPTVLDGINFPKFLSVYSAKMGVPAEVMRTEDEVNAIAQQRQQAQQAQAQAQQMQQAGAAMNQGAQAMERMSNAQETSSGADLLRELGIGGGDFSNAAMAQNMGY